MDKQARQLAGLIEAISFYFGTQNIDGECCEGISHAEFRALRAALHGEICTMQDIAKSAVVTKSGATRIIGRLEEKGLVTREQDQKDGRVCCVTLTEKGKCILSRIEDQLINKMSEILAGMEPSMRDILIISLHAFLSTAQRQMVKRARLEVVA